jgi:Xaa-Pro aminopeptidase
MAKLAAKEFLQRRQTLMEMMAPNSIAILPAASIKIRNRDAEFAFRQDSDFHYLTGFNEPEAVAVLIPGREHGEYILFCRERKREEEIWTGYRAGPEGAIESYGAHDAFPVSDIDEILPGMIEGKDRVYYSMGCDPQFDKHVMEWVNAIKAKVRSGAHPPGEFAALDHLLHDMRLFKSEAELSVMRESAQIAADAHVHAMQVCQPGMMEYQLEGEFIHQFMKRGARSPAYTTIVGGGANGCILHYVENDQALEDGDLVLIDAGCELDMYASDITRTFPVNGKFSEPQRLIYQLVLDSQIAAIEQVKPGNHWNDPHAAAVEVLAKGLIELGLLDGDLETVLKEEQYKKYYMHRTGHWLGMDVHDVGEYKVGGEWRVLEPGMVMTVEPGIYIAPDDETVDAKWRGIGVRIEDDVAVTAEGYEVMTSGVPKSVADIEALMSK